MSEIRKQAKWIEPDEASLDQICRKCPSHIFRAYDIRGKTSLDLTMDNVYLIGRAIGTETIAKGLSKIAVGRDCRETSEGLSKSLIAGLLRSGIDVVDVGMVPTPLLYFATSRLEVWNGVMVTGSHNPKEYNGLKIMLSGQSLSGPEISSLFERVRDKRFSKGKGDVSSICVDDDYLNEVERCSFSHEKKLKIIIDAGNGMAGILAPKILKKLGHHVIEMFCNIDGAFPNHHPDPSQPKNLEGLKKMIEFHQADFGLAFDGDADRLGVVDRTGEIIWPDRQLIIFVRDLLSREASAKVVFDVKCSKVLKEEIEKLGGVAIISKTGHSFIKKTMSDVGASLGGEMSGHFFLKERWYGFDDAIYSAVRLVEILSRSENSVSEVFSSVLSGVSTPEININLEEGEPQKLIEKIQSVNFIEDAEISLVDGFRADFANSWGLVRASNTTPSLVFRFEGDDDQALEFVKSKFREVFSSIDPLISLPF